MILYIYVKTLKNVTVILEYYFISSHRTRLVYSNTSSRKIDQNWNHAGIFRHKKINIRFITCHVALCIVDGFQLHYLCSI